MSQDLYTCPNCGAALSLEQLRGTDCFYCKAAFPHHARAVEHAALVQQIMAGQMAAQGYTPPPPGTHVPHGYGVTPPAYGAPPPYGAGPPPYAPQLHAADLQRSGQKVVMIVVVVGLAAALAVVGLAVAGMFLFAVR